MRYTQQLSKKKFVRIFCKDLEKLFEIILLIVGSDICTIVAFQNRGQIWRFQKGREDRKKEPCSLPNLALSINLTSSSRRKEGPCVCVCMSGRGARLLARSRHHYRSRIPGWTPGVSRGDARDTRRVVDDVHLVIRSLHPSSSIVAGLSQVGIVRALSLWTRPSNPFRSSPHVPALVVGKIRSCGTDVRARRIENMSITVRATGPARAFREGFFSDAKQVGRTIIYLVLCCFFNATFPCRGQKRTVWSNNMLSIRRKAV